MKKKIISFMFSMLMLGNINVFAQREATVNTEQNNIYIAGGVTDNIQNVTVMMKNDSEVAYIREVPVNDGEYSFKFKFNKDYTDYNLYVMDGKENITDTVMETKAEAFYPAADVKSSEFSEDGTTADIAVDITNKYNNSGTAKVIISWYDENNVMVSCETKNVSYDYYSGEYSETVNVPEGAVRGKVFVWSTLSNCVPLGNAGKALPKKNILCIGDSLGQTYTDESATRGWGQLIGNYMDDDAEIVNYCHSGWNTLTYLVKDDENTNNFWDQGWNAAKKNINEGDYVIFGLGYNDYAVMGYNGKYYETVDGIRKFYDPTGGPGTLGNKTDWAFEKLTDENGDEYVEINGEKVKSGPLTWAQQTSTHIDGHLTYLYLDDNGVVQSYAADAFYDNMKIMLDDCVDLGVNVVIRNIACINNTTGQSRENGYHAYITQSIINEKIELLDDEYENVVAVDLFTETRNHFKDVYNSFENEAPDYAYDENGELYPWYSNVTNWRSQQLNDTYWLTVKHYIEYFNGGEGVIGKDADGNDVWKYQKPDGSIIAQDTLHYSIYGADYMASAIAKLIKNSESALAEYIK